jgi:nitrile hydratase accessory protein
MTSPLDPDAALRATAAVTSIPIDAEGPVFREPWEAHAFAMTLALNEGGSFTWDEWTADLAEEIEAAAGDPDNGDTYYQHWLTALERMIVKKGLASSEVLNRYRDAWDHAADRTPHGQPIELQPSDFPE